MWDPHPGARSPPSIGASIGPQFQSQAPIPVWVSPCWYRCQHGTSLPGSNPSASMGAGGIPIPVQDPILVLGSHPSTGATTVSPIPVQDTPFPYQVPIPVCVLEWDLPSHYGARPPSQYRCGYETSHPNMGHPNPLRVLGQDSPSQYGSWDWSLVLVPGSHPGIDTSIGSPTPVQDAPCRYWVPILVWVPLRDLHLSMGAGTTPSCCYRAHSPGTGAGTRSPVPVRDTPCR